MSALARQGGGELSYDGELCAGEMLVPAGFSPGTGVCARGERRGEFGMRRMGAVGIAVWVKGGAIGLRPTLQLWRGCCPRFARGIAALAGGCPRFVHDLAVLAGVALGSRMTSRFWRGCCPRFACSGLRFWRGRCSRFMRSGLRLWRACPRYARGIAALAGHCPRFVCSGLRLWRGCYPRFACSGL